MLFVLQLHIWLSLNHQLSMMHKATLLNLNQRKKQVCTMIFILDRNKYVGMKRPRCNCTGCSRNDCGDCNYCKDMKKFSGPGKKKKQCIIRQCLNVKSSYMTTSKQVHAYVAMLLYHLNFYAGCYNSINHSDQEF